MEFNEAQKTALSHVSGPMMVLAGPGSGKTTVITHRIRRLLLAGVSPSSILVITFTKAAAREMEERFLALPAADGAAGKNPAAAAVGQNPAVERKRVSGQAPAGAPTVEGQEQKRTRQGGRVTFGTFHSVFYQILRLAYRFPAGNVIGEDEKREFFRNFLAKTDFDVEDEGEFISSVIGEISFVKGNRLDLSCYYSQNCPEEWFKRLYEGYEKLLASTGKLDFDDMLTMCYDLFTERKDILAAWQRKFQYILVDEFQDINRLQYEIVRMLALPENNLFIVGDDDQSIYRFRGARPEIMLGFERDYPNCRRVLLGTNYRSTKEIVELSLKLIGHNKKRFEKKLVPFRGSGRAADFTLYENAPAQMEAVAGALRQYYEAGYSWEEMAVLFRTGMSSGLLAEKLMEYNVPFVMRDKIPDLYSHWIARDFFAYLRLGAGGRRRSDFFCVMNRPNRYFSRDAFPRAEVLLDEVRAFYSDKDWMEERIDDLEADLRTIGRLAPGAAVNYIRKAVGYDEYLKSYAEFRRIDPAELYEIADQLRESAAGFGTLGEWQEHVRQYEEELARQREAAGGRIPARAAECEGAESPAGRVTLSTMHSAKGLEYRVVFLVDANEGITPHHKAALPDDIEEERRLFYVAMTRAKDRLHISAVKERHHRKQEVSRFVRECMEEEGNNGTGTYLLRRREGQDQRRDRACGSGSGARPSGCDRPFFKDGRFR